MPVFIWIDRLQLKTNLERTATYHRTFEMANFVKISAENITNLRMIPFSSIPDVATVIDEKVSAFTPQTGEAKASEMKLAELQSQMTKSLSTPAISCAMLTGRSRHENGSGRQDDEVPAGPVVRARHASPGLESATGIPSSKISEGRPGSRSPL